MTGVISKPMPSPLRYPMMGLSPTTSDPSFTSIRSPSGT